MGLKIRKNKKSYTILDMYKPFIEETGIDIPYSTFKTILTECNKEILNVLQNKSDGFKMPFGLGYIRIVKYKPKSMTDKSLSVDYKASKEYNKRIYHLNEHSDGYKFRLYWSKLPQTFPNRYKYQLCFTRKNKRDLAQLIFNKYDYIDINDIQIYQL